MPRAAAPGGAKAAAPPRAGRAGSSLDPAPASGLRLSSHAECRALTGLAAHLATRPGIQGTARRLRRGERLYGAGDATDRLYLVTEGVVHTHLMSESGRELRLGAAHAGDAVGELCFCSVRRRSESAVAATDAVVVPVLGEEVVRYAGSGSEAAREVLEHLFHRIAVLTGRVEELAFASARERLLRRLSALAAAAGLAPDGAVTLPAASHEDWARQVYATREQVSAVLADLRRRGAIDYHGHPSALTVYPARLARLLDTPEPNVQMRTDA